MDRERIEGFSEAFGREETLRWEIPKTEKERMRFLQGKGVRIPKDIQMIGFDDNMASRESNPTLTTIHQDTLLRTETAVKCLEAMRGGAQCETEIVLPVENIIVGTWCIGIPLCLLAAYIF